MCQCFTGRLARTEDLLRHYQCYYTGMDDALPLVMTDMPMPPDQELDLSTENLVAHLRFLLNIGELSLDLISPRPSTVGVVAILRTYVQQTRARLASATAGGLL